MKNIKQFIQQGDRFARYVGIDLIEVTPGSATATLTIDDRHLNAVNIAHGAAIFSLADLAFAAAANSYGTVAVAINVNISFLRAVGRGVLTARATETSRNHKLATYSIRISDEAGNRVASFEGMVYRKKDKIALEP